MNKTGQIVGIIILVIVLLIPISFAMSYLQFVIVTSKFADLRDRYPTPDTMYTAGNLKAIEAIVHPLVRADRDAFAAETETDIAVFDIPLLFETGGQSEMDATACVYVPYGEQRRRVLERGTMSEADFEWILDKQMPIQDKLDRSDFTIRTTDLETARADVQTVLEEIRKRL